MRDRARTSRWTGLSGVGRDPWPGVPCAVRFSQNGDFSVVPTP